MWVYDLRTNAPPFGKRTPFTREYLQPFVDAFGNDPTGLKNKRKDEGEQGRFRAFTRDDIEQRKDNLDITWLKDDNAHDEATLGEPDEIAAEIRVELQSALRRRDWEAQLRSRGKDPNNASYDEPPAPNPENLPPIPTSWSWSSLDELRRVSEPLCYGVVQPGEEAEKDGVVLIRVCDLDRGTVLVEQLRTITSEVDAQYARSRVKGGEILISVVGTIGRTAIVPPLTTPTTPALPSGGTP